VRLLADAPRPLLERVDRSDGLTARVARTRARGGPSSRADGREAGSALEPRTDPLPRASDHRRNRIVGISPRFCLRGSRLPSFSGCCCRSVCRLSLDRDRGPQALMPTSPRRGGQSRRVLVRALCSSASFSAIFILLAPSARRYRHSLNSPNTRLRADRGYLIIAWASSSRDSVRLDGQTRVRTPRRCCGSPAAAAPARGGGVREIAWTPARASPGGDPHAGVERGLGRRNAITRRAAARLLLAGLAILPADTPVAFDRIDPTPWRSS